ncbi:hypothetical protein [Roseateles paludis]|uniref:Phasin domain-containing protein n=1 Tax=Roseateles paludis TaxID=3145238 RepID=A0ABV0G1S0_9BURK
MATKKPAGKAAGKMEARPAEAPDPEKSEALAKLALRPSVNAAAVVAQYAKPIGVDEDDIGALMGQLSDDVEKVWAGDMKRAEAMLFGQAHALQAIFMSLARRANSQDYLKQWEAYLRMALKAQNQCRMTLETLATIKNPPVVIARQANINNGGQQQVNNGAAPAPGEAPAHAVNPEAAPTELLEQQHGEWLDTGATSAAGGTDPLMAPVGEVHRPAKR